MRQCGHSSITAITQQECEEGELLLFDNEEVVTEIEKKSRKRIDRKKGTLNHVFTQETYNSVQKE